MKIFDIFKISLINLFRQKTRAALTLCGVILGSASITLTFAIGEAVKQNGVSLLQNSKDLRMIEISLMNTDNSNNSSKKNYLDDNFINKLKNINNVQSVFYYLDVTSYGNISYTSGSQDKYYSMGDIYGVNFDDMEKFGLKLMNNKSVPQKNYKFQTSNKTIRVVSGQYFEYDFLTKLKNKINSRYNNSPAMQYMMSKWNPDFQSQTLPPFINASKDNINICIRYPNEISTQISEYDINYNPDDDNQNTLNQSPYKYKRYAIDLYGRYNWEAVKDDPILGFIAQSGLFVDMETAKTLIREYNSLNKITGNTLPEFQYRTVVVEANDIDSVSNITKEIKKMGYNVDNLISEIEKEQLQAQANQFILGFLGILALLVSAISIANTMITSVYERTKEIGIMKVLGCKIGNIQFMFLIESGLIGLVGGCLGVGCSYLLSNFMNKLIVNEGNNSGFFTKIISNYIEGMKSDLSSYLGGNSTMKVAIVDFQLCLLVICGVTFIGLAAGYIPSVIASKIEALKAIKTNK